MKNTGKLILFSLLLIALTTACKFFFGANRTWSGFSPVIAIALFAGFVIRQRDYSFLLPLLALFISDAIIHVLYLQGVFDYAGFYSGQWKNYLVLLSATLIGWSLKGRKLNSLFAGAVAAPTVFFIISNFMVWLSAGEVVYGRDFSGLMTCYAAGLPFYKNALMATLVFLPGILLIYNYMTRQKAVLTLA